MEGKLGFNATQNQKKGKSTNLNKTNTPSKRGKGQPKDDNPSVDNYAKVMSPLKFDSAPLLEMVGKSEIAYVFKKEADQAQARKGMMRVMQEVSSLSTSLPIE